MKTETETEVESGELPVKRTAVVDMVRGWRDAEASIREAFRLIVSAQKTLRGAFDVGDEPSYLFGVHRGGRQLDYEDPERLMAELKKDAWRCIIRKLELRRILSVARCKDLDNQLETGKGLPEINERDILAMLDGVLSSADIYIEEAVREVFDYLRPPRSHYVTNEKVKWQCGRKVILSWAVDGDCRKWRVNYHREDELRAA